MALDKSRDHSQDASQKKSAEAPNVGLVDRVIRGVLGTWLVMTSVGRLFSIAGILQFISGFCLVTSATTGQCSMMRWMNASTIPGQNNNLLNQFKQAMPGQGINPIQTQQAKPQRETRQINPNEPMADAYAIA